MRFEEYRKHDAISLARLIAKRQVSAEEVLETAIARAEQVNPGINAIVHKQYERARKAVAAGLPEGPLKGVPYLIKDLGFFETGEPATFGSSLFKDFVADHETAYVTRCKKAGLVFMGRSSSPEFGLNPNTEPRLYGSCHNPWDLEYSPGGSSGGAAAAVSAGILPWRMQPTAAARSGSRRRSAACSASSRHAAGYLWRQTPAKDGVGCLPDMWSAAACATRPACSIAPPEWSSATPIPHRCKRAPSSKPSRVTRKLRIALMLKDHRGVKLHPECLEAVQRAAKLCASLGHVVEEADPNLDMVALLPMNARISAANTARSCHMRWKALGREPNADDVEAATWAVYQRGLKVSGIEYIEAIAAAHAAGRKMGAFLTSYDVILSTTVASPPPKLGYFDQNGDVQTFTESVTEYLSVTPLHNATGTPAMSVPLHWTADGLPVGVHFAGRYGEEATLLALAAELETAQPWFDRVPAL